MGQQILVLKLYGHSQKSWLYPWNMWQIMTLASCFDAAETAMCALYSVWLLHLLIEQSVQYEYVDNKEWRLMVINPLEAEEQHYKAQNAEGLK